MACEEFNFSDNTVPCTAVIVGIHFKLLMTYPRSISGSTFTMVIKNSKEEVPLLALTNTIDPLLSGFYAVDLANGKQELIISSVDSVALGAGVYLYDIVETTSSGLILLNMEGTLEVKERIV